MKRRGATLLLGVLLLVGMIAGSWNTTVPYVALGPGPTYDTLALQGGPNSKPVIQIDGTRTYDSKGQLRMVTVGVAPELTLAQALRGWLNHDEAVWPKELVYPPDKTQDQVDQENVDQFKRSQSSAETVALRALGYPVHVRITEVAADQPAAGKLKVGDVINTVDGTPITSTQKLIGVLRGQPAGANHTFEVVRGDDKVTVVVPTKAGSDGVARVGIDTVQDQPHPFTITIELAGIGGPSAGLMFALGVTDKLTKDDLTGGLRIAGTGTIDDEGDVGPIGGIPQKMVAAKHAGATIFLVPEANCAEALDNQVAGLQMVKVETYEGALHELETLRNGGQATKCTAG